jgi:chemotaxis protein methyltransferase CheR
MNNIKPFTQEEFKRFCDFIYNNAGINLTEKKYSLVNNRLRKRVRFYEFNSYNEYFDWVVNTEEGKHELENLINQITTNVSSFFREPKQLKIFYETILPDLAEKQSSLKIWSAGCSTGEEPYTIAMILLKFGKLDFEILATDLSTKVLRQAQQGIYTEENVKSIDPATLKKFFMHQPNSKEFKVISEVKKNVKFAQLNLIEDKYYNNIDMIFCRNVIIYFDRPTKDKVMKGFHSSLKPGGTLFLGHSESLFNNPLFKFYKPSIYLKV